MVVYQVQEMAAHYGIVPGICLLGTSSRWATTMTICTLCVEIDATYSDPPIRIKLLSLRSSQGQHPAHARRRAIDRDILPPRLPRKEPRRYQQPDYHPRSHH